MGLTKFKFILWYDHLQATRIVGKPWTPYMGEYRCLWWVKPSGLLYCRFFKIINCWSLTDFKAINYCNRDWYFSCSHMAVWKHSCNRNKEARGSFTLNCITWVSGFSEASLVNITWYKGMRIQFILTNLECVLCEMLLEQQNMTLKFFFLLDFE